MTAGSHRFPTTSWTLVLNATGPEPRRSAFGLLCETYWPPVFAYLRRQVQDVEEAKDLTQGFFTRLVEKHDLSGLERDRGRFRWYLLACVRHFAANERDRARARKRGGGQPHIRLDLQEVETRSATATSEALSPEQVFERRWALMMLDRALRTVRRQYEEAGLDRQFERLKVSLVEGRKEGGYLSLGKELGMTEGAVKMAVHRLRRRFAAALRDEVGLTVADPAEVEDELRHLFDALRSRP